MIIINVGKL